MIEFFVYILQSGTGKKYIGQTNNLKDRLFRHNSGRSTFTKNKGPWNLIVSVKVPSRADAVSLESKLKRMKNSSKAIAYLEKLNRESDSLGV